MALNDTLANMLSKILNSEASNKESCLVSPVSKQMLKVLEIMKKHHYVGDYVVTDDKKGKQVEINLINSINKCGVIKPRFSFKKDQLEKYESRFLPAKDFGIIIVSTSKGMITHAESKEKNLGGKLIAYVY